MWPRGAKLELVITTLVIGLPVRWWCSVPSSRRRPGAPTRRGGVAAATPDLTTDPGAWLCVRVYPQAACVLFPLCPKSVPLTVFLRCDYCNLAMSSLGDRC